MIFPTTVFFDASERVFPTFIFGQAAAWALKISKNSVSSILACHFEKNLSNPCSQFLTSNRGRGFDSFFSMAGRSARPFAMHPAQALRVSTFFYSTVRCTAAVSSNFSNKTRYSAAACRRFSKSQPNSLPKKSATTGATCRAAAQSKISKRIRFAKKSRTEPAISTRAAWTISAFKNGKLGCIRSPSC